MVVKILMEDMTLDRRRAFEACNAETSYDIVQTLLNIKWQRNNKTYEL